MPPKLSSALSLLCSLNYRSAILSGSPNHLNRLQKVRNNAARLIYKCSKFDHITPHLHILHWLPIEKKKRDLFNFVSLCFKFVNGFGPLSIFLIFFHSTHLPDSLVLLLTHVIFRISFFRSKFYRQRSFSCQGTPGIQGT